ncbi:MAG TPA: FAD-dependent oxidoreductase, partial [Polyangiales bacterium]|nr:FAD-dependent oxidoreductase [Polyangiales bacterium]
MRDRFDLVVLGAGPAGEKGAAQAAYFGKRVAIVEQAPEPGGAGVHTGTLPSKTLREAAVFLSGQRARTLYGMGSAFDASATLERLMTRKSAIQASESRRIRENLQHHGVQYFHGRAHVAEAHLVTVQGADGLQELETEHVLIATGSTPARAPGIDFADTRVHDSDEILGIDELPRSMIILGAGVIGCEYACMFAALGADVTLVDVRESVLSFLDGELVERLLAAMKQAGVTLRTGLRWTRVSRTGDEVTAHFADGSELRAGHLLYCAGRTGATQGLGLVELGVKVGERGHVQVDADYRTHVPNVFAAGDVIGFPGLASSAMEQARVAVCKAFGFEYKSAVSALMPFGIYTIPALSAVG